MKIMMILLSFILFTNIVIAGPGKSEKEKGEWFKKELNLTDEQMAKVKEIKKAHKPDMREQKKELQALKKSFKDAMKDPNASNEDLIAKFEAFQKARDASQRNRFAMMLKMREILTPEQMEKLHELKRKHKGKFRDKVKEKMKDKKKK